MAEQLTYLHKHPLLAIECKRHVDRQHGKVVDFSLPPRPVPVPHTSMLVPYAQLPHQFHIVYPYVQTL